ncbi:TonB-dependent receptor [Agaribacterium haliotis]|uniref:TonB-dependent receptor n=1 Tax=Agaribacterium haliotis TaxID=2013869 RepID=UPI000BB547DA|nr:TonB-dependent receptor [Agaribacterium haliotis]
MRRLAFRHRWFKTFCASGLTWLCSLSLALAAELDQRHKLRIKSDYLLPALIELGLQTDTDILVSVNIPAQQLCVDLEGSYSTREALNILLQGSNYEFRQVAEGSVAIRKKAIAEAPQAELDVDPASLERMLILGDRVTGSHIRKPRRDGFSPLDVLDSEQFARSGTQSLSKLLKFVPAVSGNSTSTAVSNGGDGTTKVALRGLPANNTLVLVNGQRAVFDGLAGDSVDLNNIAPIAIDQVEIYKDGASAIYGSDAIAGVVNVRMLEQYKGVKLEHYRALSSRGDTATNSTNALFGSVGERASALLSLSYFEQEALFSRQRDLSASADMRARGGLDKRVSATPYTRLTLADGQNLIYDNSSALSVAPEVDNQTGSDDYRPVNSEDLFDYFSQTSSISPSERLSIYGSSQYQLSEQMQLKAFILYGQTEATITLASSPIYTAFLPEPVAVSRDNIYNPFGEDILDLRRRVIELDPREQTNYSRSLYSNVGFNYDFGHAELVGHVYWNETKAREKRTNLVDSQRLAFGAGPAQECQGAAIDGCVPINLFGAPGSIDAEQLDYITASEQSQGQSKIYGVNSAFSEQLDVGELGFDYALGLDLRKEQSRFDPAEQDVHIIGSVSQSPTEGDRSVVEIYAETYWQLYGRNSSAKIFDLDLAARLTESSDFGEALTPKFGVRKSLGRQLLLRASYSKGFRAPSIKELHTNGNTTYESLTDPCSISSNVGTLPGCLQQSDTTLNQFLTEYSGSTKLEPEVSENKLLGLFFQPDFISGLSSSVDMYIIDVDNVIDSQPQTIVNENAANGRFADYVERDQNGNITLIKSPFVNTGNKSLKGVDFNIMYNRGDYQINLNASYLHKYTRQLSESSAKEQLAGSFKDVAASGNGALPRWKVNLGINRNIQDFTLSYAAKYVGSLTESFLSAEEIEVSRDVSSWLIHDLQLAYVPSDKIVYASIGVENMLDNTPPFLASAFNDNYDARSYDIKGRFFYATLGLRFE